MPTYINIQEVQSVANLLDVQELEEYLLKKFNPAVIDISPKTEAELYSYYSVYTCYLYQYLRQMVGSWLYPLSNEIRAILGHMADYRVSDSGKDPKNLDKAYGHFRRLTIDALKILCDEFDKSLSRQLKKQYSFDYRNVCVNYLDIFASKYIGAKKKYIEAQTEEMLGSDHGKHNIIDLYYQAAKEYIELKQFYLQNKPRILAIQRNTRLRNCIRVFCALFGIGVSVLSYLIA